MYAAVYLSGERVGTDKKASALLCSDSRVTRNATDATAAAADVARPRLRTESNGGEWLFC